MKFKFIPQEIPDVVLIEHEAAVDDRGYFAETFREDAFVQAGIKGPFVQENHSRSEKGVLRGLHFQKKARALAKLVRCVRGAIFDVAVDVRKGSPTYKRWVGVKLTDENRHMLFVPAGFAHGFVTLSGQADVIYRQTDYWSPENDRGVRWDDPALAIGWPVDAPRVSTKDSELPLLADADNDF